MAPDVTRSIEDSLKAAGLNDVSVSQDREKSVVTLKGSVTNEADKAKAEALAKSTAGGQVIGNEIAVLPPGRRVRQRPLTPIWMTGSRRIWTPP